ncbi:MULTISPECIES: crotonyl-CoA carboxylase/reductase [Streptomycetaceae]|uniref:Crotonyl-CoA reductase n=1 Tax=Streptantibioticus cattleyicolor (strain ATCC 35852 / DSM 46488 / JCM 4925 / NBRC 14057 / NRRL 8057) TaxID=1003195 RepID=F8JUW0_STREN|nr:crotonyl-CoA carboxylase/reductase [Streptantibioticus cattleyicolor]AEW98122.1 crotonyl-CoA reductase [Streptantibioticus cattleyicolor NRRL 8057 = DSM 46488]MYS62511.1 crotonyl-CoA carboxylase/reductase [Streptomyces sp. SID5468]CCB78435.1 Crotonyl-CoA reductase [Streptantibioticus cattleyicolor NRRL 8057 = DSM 46488]
MTPLTALPELSAAVVAGASAEELAGTPLPERFPAAHLLADDTRMFDGDTDKDVRRSLRVGPVDMPELAPDEVLVAVMASAINFNTVWSAMFEPIPTFRFLERMAARGGWDTRHNLPYQVVGSDAAGVVVRVGNGVRHWSIGDHVVINPNYADDQEPDTQADGMLGPGQLAWGFETNFGGLAHYAVVRATQLLPKPAHLTWEEAACNPLCAGTAYRMLVGEHGARLKQGDTVLIWGASGGLGGYAVQLVRNGGGTAVGVVGTEEKAEAVRRLGCDIVVNRHEIGLDDRAADDPVQVVAVGKRLGKLIRKETGDDPNIVFEHVGRATFGASLFVARRGGVVVTCGSSTGYQHQFDNRYLWMRLKRIIGSHGANYQEQWETNRLISTGRIASMLSAVYPLDDVGEAARMVQTNQHLGKVGVLCLAPRPGLGVTDAGLRAALGPDRLAPLAPDLARP